MRVAGGVDRGARAGQQHVVQMRVEARFDDQDFGHLSAACSIARSSTIARP